MEWYVAMRSDTLRYVAICSYTWRYHFMEISLWHKCTTHVHIIMLCVCNIMYLSLRMPLHFGLIFSVSLCLTFYFSGEPHNPMINSGAIAIMSLVKRHLNLADRFDYVSLKCIHGEHWHFSTYFSVYTVQSYNIAYCVVNVCYYLEYIYNCSPLCTLF
jgi:hypothetical protein